MSSKEDYCDEKLFDEKNEYDSKSNPPKIDITSISIDPTGFDEISSPISLKIQFELDRDVVASYWVIQLLVDSSHNRIIKVLGETDVEDYPDGESDMSITIKTIDVSDIPPSTLTNSGLLMAKFIVDGEEVASVNMVIKEPNRDLVMHILTYFTSF